MNIYAISDINECESNPCQNGGSCLDLEGGFSCLCDAGWQGDLCNIGEYYVECIFQGRKIYTIYRKFYLPEKKFGHQK